MNEAQVLEALDELIERATPGALPALVVVLSARLSTLGALVLTAAAIERRAQSSADDSERNLSAKEAAARLGGSTAAQATSRFRGGDVRLSWVCNSGKRLQTLLSGGWPATLLLH